MRLLRVVSCLASAAVLTTTSGAQVIMRPAAEQGPPPRFDPRAWALLRLVVAPHNEGGGCAINRLERDGRMVQARYPSADTALTQVTVWLRPDGTIRRVNEMRFAEPLVSPPDSIPVAEKQAQSMEFMARVSKSMVMLDYDTGFGRALNDEGRGMIGMTADARSIESLASLGNPRARAERSAEICAAAIR
jgi:hypothetical protein